MEVPNHPKVLWTKTMVLSVREKGSSNCQVCVKEMNEHVNRLRKCRKRRDSIKTGGKSLIRDKSGGNLFTDQAVGGIKAA